MILLNNDKGVSIIAAIFIIVILAFMGVMFLSLIGTGSFTAVNDMQAMQAFSIAEGGVEFEQRSLSQSIDWYRGTTDPLYNDTRNLGSGGGSLTASTRVPATALRRRLQPGDLTASVYTTAGFSPNGFLQIDDNVATGAEFVRYTIQNGNTFNIVRAQPIGTIATVANNFSRGTYVYPVSTLVDALANACNTPASFRITANVKLLGSGTVTIEGEEIVYSGSSTAGGNITLTGVQRCLNGAVSAAHSVGQPVTPLLFGGSADLQSEVTSTGTIGAAVRVVRKTVQR